MSKSQYLYVNTANRDNGTPYNFSVTVAPAITCNENERLAISITSFKLTRTWNWLNEKNNMFIVRRPDLGVNELVIITPGNYTFKKLVREVNSILNSRNIPIGFIYNPTTNRVGITAYRTPDGSSIYVDFTGVNSAYDVFKFPKENVLIPVDFENAIYSTSTLSIDQAQEFRLYIENVPTSNTAPNFENDTSKQLQPSQCVFVFRADLAPYSTYYTVAQEILFTLDLDTKEIQKMVFTLRDEKGNLVDYMTSDYLFSVRVDTINMDCTYENRQIELLQEIVEYQRLNFVKGELGP